MTEDQKDNGLTLLLILFSIALLCVAFSGCATYVLRLNDGRVVFCKDVLPDYCGYELSRCEDKVDYHCMTNLSEILDDDLRKEALRIHEEEKKRKPEVKKENFGI